MYIDRLSHRASEVSVIRAMTASSFTNDVRRHDSCYAARCDCEDPFDAIRISASLVSFAREQTAPSRWICIPRLLTNVDALCGPLMLRACQQCCLLDPALPAAFYVDLFTILCADTNEPSLLRDIAKAAHAMAAPPVLSRSLTRHRYLFCRRTRMKDTPNSPSRIPASAALPAAGGFYCGQRAPYS